MRKRLRRIGLILVAVPVLLAIGLEAYIRYVWWAADRANLAGAAKQCTKPLSPEEALRNSSAVFEGIVIDKSSMVWPRVSRRVDSYRFQVIRAWGPPAEIDDPAPPAPAPVDIRIDHHFDEYYAYRSFELGRRYLVFAILHDSPAQMWVWRCSPVAEGADIPAVAARLGPPRATYDEKPAIALPSFSASLKRALMMRLAVAYLMKYEILAKLLGES